MSSSTDLLILVVTLLVLVFSGVHIAISLGLTALLGLFLMTGDPHAMLSFASNTAYEALRDYVFAVIPLFLLMGEFLAKCGAASDLFALVNRLTRRLAGRHSGPSDSQDRLLRLEHLRAGSGQRARARGEHAGRRR